MIKKNKILFLHGSNDLYGASKVLINVIDILIKKNYEIHLILPYKGPLDIIFGEKIKIYHKNLGVFRKKYFNPIGLLNRFNKILHSIFFINKLIKDNNISLVYTNTSVIVAGGISAKINSIKSFVHIHEIPMNKYYLAFMRIIVDLIFDKIIVVSNAVKNHWNFRLENKITLIYNGLENNNMLKLKESKNNIITFVCVSRLIPYKGHLYLIDIAHKLKKYKLNCVFYIVGDSFRGYENYESNLKKYVKENNLENNIVFAGFQKNIISFLNNSDFLIHTPIDPDPLPTVILEAMNLGVPIIATKLGGNIELLNNGKGGLLIPKNNADQSAKLIINFSSNSQEIIKKIKYSKSFFRLNFNKENFQQNILSLFNF